MIEYSYMLPQGTRWVASERVTAAATLAPSAAAAAYATTASHTRVSDRLARSADGMRPPLLWVLRVCLVCRCSLVLPIHRGAPLRCAPRAPYRGAPLRCAPRAPYRGAPLRCAPRALRGPVKVRPHLGRGRAEKLQLNDARQLLELIDEGH